MKKILITIIAVLLALSGCGKPTDQTNPGAEVPLTENQDTEDKQPDDETSKEPENDQEAPEQTEDETLPPSDEAHPVPEPEQTPVKATHYMTSHYIFKPIEEDGNSKVVLLTFDDGPKEEEMVNDMLETLDKHNAKAIFFVNGYRVKAKPELLKKIHDHGQVIGNHSWDHVVLSELSEEAMRQQVGDVQQLVEEITGAAPQFFRPPHGAGNDTLKQIVKEEGMLYMTWSNGSRDWEKDYQKPELVVEQVLEQLHRGSNILMHELPWTVEALDDLLTKLKEEGYSFLDPAAIRLEDEASVSPTT